MNVNLCVSMVAAVLVTLTLGCGAKGTTLDGGTDGGASSASGCMMEYDQDSRDRSMVPSLVKVDDTGSTYNLELPKEMTAWLEERNWVQGHGDWHNVRRWDQQCGGQTSTCAAIAELTNRGLTRAPVQEQQTGDGYGFLVAHRHMIRGFRSAFPNHAWLISGFHAVPMSGDDSENPIPWMDVNWTPTQKAGFALMQDIEDNLAFFNSEDELGQWIQFAINGSSSSTGSGMMGGGLGGDGGFGPPPGGDGGFGPPPGFDGGGLPPDFDGGMPGGGMGGGPGTGSSGGTDDGGVTRDSQGRPVGGLHGALHSMWNVPGSSEQLTDNNVNTRLYAFWKLHGWIDDIWERYRVARGVGESDPAYLTEMENQCGEMERLVKAKPRSLTASVDAGVVSGVFATQVQPIFTTYCAGCHDSTSPEGGLVLSGSAAETVRLGIVGRTSPQTSLKLVEPSNPEQSWLIRKLESNFAGITCNPGVVCQTTMPPSGAAPSPAQIAIIRSWIQAGATGQ